MCVYEQQSAATGLPPLNPTHQIRGQAWLKLQFSMAICLSSLLLCYTRMCSGGKAVLLFLPRLLDLADYDLYIPLSPSSSVEVKQCLKSSVLISLFLRLVLTYVQPPADLLVWQALMFNLKSFHSLD